MIDDVHNYSRPVKVDVRGCRGDETTLSLSFLEEQIREGGVDVPALGIKLVPKYDSD